LGKYSAPVIFWVLPPPSELLQEPQVTLSWNSAIPESEPLVGAVMLSVEFAAILTSAGLPLVV
jgi:hypothetical protein